MTDRNKEKNSNNYEEKNTAEHNSFIDGLKRLDKTSKIKFGMFVIVITFILCYPVYKIISTKSTKNKGIETKAKIYDKYRFLGVKPLRYSYYIKLEYYDNENKLHKTSVGIDIKKYNCLKIGDSIEIKYLPFNNEVIVNDE